MEGGNGGFEGREGGREGGAYKVLFVPMERGELQGTGVLCWWVVDDRQRQPGKRCGKADRQEAIAVTLASESESKIIRKPISASSERGGGREDRG